MDEQRWTLVDDYVAEKLLHEDRALHDAVERAESAGLPAISVTAPHGKFLHLLARIQRASRILEIGTLGGYSTIWLARAVEHGGRVITLEVDPKHAEVARSNIGRAGLSDRVEIRVGPALESLPTLVQHAPFDLIFIDADKPSTPKYFEWAVRLSRPGSLILVDNVVQHGRLVEADSDDANVKGMRALCELVSAESRVSATVIQTVGTKGYDGLLVALVGAK